MSKGRNPTSIPLFDLGLSHEAIFSELISAVEKVARDTDFINGKAVTDFESAFGRYHSSAHAIAMSSGTDALLVALMALGVGPGDEVITTPFTFVSTAEVILRVGAIPVFVDIEPETFCIDANEIAPKISSNTKAIIPVHLFGRACSMDLVMDLANEAGISVIEDCAQAMGTRFHGQPIGTFGDFGAFSFFPTKNLGGWGDGGMLLCSSDDLALDAKAIRDHGARTRGRYEILGGNFRLDSIQAAVLHKKLNYTNDWKRQRQLAARRYNELFENAGLCGHESSPLVLPAEDGQGEHSFGLYVVRARDRDALADHLSAASIACGKYYDLPLHLQGCFSHLGHGQGDFPVAEAASSQVLALACYAGINESAQMMVVEEVARFYSS